VPRNFAAESNDKHPLCRFYIPSTGQVSKMEAMDLQQLKQKTPGELLIFAEELEIEGQAICAPRI